MRGFLACSLFVALLSACSGDDTLPDGKGGASGASGGSSGSGARDAQAEQSSGGTGGADTGSPAGDTRDSTSPDGAPDTAESAAADSPVADSIASDMTVDAGSEASDAAPTVDADAMSCRRPTAPDASTDASRPGTITNLMGYSASDVLYITWADQAGAVPRNRYLDLRFDPSPAVCAATLAGERKANGSQLQILLLRSNFLMWGTLPSFFGPGTYPLSENVYDQDAGIASVADVNLVTTDGSCQQTFTRATGGSLILTSVTPSHVAGTFTALFDDAGTVSGGFDVELCFDAELPECPYACVP